MKRDGHIIEEIIERANLEDSFDTVVRGSKRKALKEGRWLLAHREEFLDGVAAELGKGDITLSPPRNKDVTEHGKLRHIQVFDMKSRIKVNAVMSVVDKHIRQRFIRTTSASIKGRGMHELKAYIQRDMRDDPTLRYWYKFDIRKFYETTRQEFVMYCVERTFKDARLIRIIATLVHLIPDGLGMSIGLRASQGLCNLLLSVFLDHYLKDRYQVAHYYRYCDDGLIGASEKRYLWECRAVVKERIESIGQTVKPNDRVFPIDEGLDFLGYVTLTDSHSRLRKRIKQDFARKLKRVKSRKRRQQLAGSLYGIAKHCNGMNLMRTLLYPSEFNKIRRKAKKERLKKMKEFSQLGVSYTPKDGKKRFANGTTQLRQLVNVKIEVLDFERDVQTKNGLRWLVQFRDTRNGALSKFFTASEEMQSDLEQIEAMDELPFATTIAAEYFGENKVKYKFT